MRTIRRLLYRDIVMSVLFVSMAFLSLFYFIDFVDELDNVGSRGRTIGFAFLSALYELPGHAYELAPIAVLIGTIYSLSRMAQSSEFTILRTAGLGPRRALALLAVLGIAFGVLTFIIGDFIAPASERLEVLHKASVRGGLRIGGAGAWLKEKRATPQGTLQVSVNVAGLGAGGALDGVRIFEFDDQGRLLKRISSPRAHVEAGGLWRLEDAEVIDWPVGLAAADDTGARSHVEPVLDWKTTLDKAVVAAALLPAETMTTMELWRYSAHLADQEQAAQRHQVQFWKKALYPFACIVMVALALPFAYLHARAGSVSFKVFGGIMLGISFVLLNNVAGHLGVLRDWTPWLVAAAPAMLYLMLSLAAFAWLVRYR